MCVKTRFILGLLLVQLFNPILCVPLKHNIEKRSIFGSFPMQMLTNSPLKSMMCNPLDDIENEFVLQTAPIHFVASVLVQPFICLALNSARDLQQQEQHVIKERSIAVKAVTGVAKRTIFGEFFFANLVMAVRNMNRKFWNVYNTTLNDLKAEFNPQITTSTIKNRPTEAASKKDIVNVNREDDVKVLSRKGRGIAFLPYLAKFSGWTMIMVAGTAASTAVELGMRDLHEKSTLERKSFDCKKNNYGCMQNVCWTNCGPRLGSFDWCITLNTTITIDQMRLDDENGVLRIEAAYCEKDSDCNPCWTCGGICRMESNDLNGELLKNNN